MSNLHINRDRQNLGQFTPEQVAEGLASGRFRPTDLVWRAGMETWQPLATFTDLPVVEVDPIPDLPPVVSQPEEPFPWDRRHKVGILSAIFETIFQTLGHPMSVFQRLAPAPAMRAPYGFYLLVAMISFAIYSLEVFVFVNYSAETLAKMPEMAGNPETAKTLGLLKSFDPRGFAFLLVAVIPCVPLVASGIYHLLLMLFGGANASFLKTFAVTCYVLGAASPFMILPCCGLIAMVFWSLLALSLGLGVAHQTDSWRSTLAVLVPSLLCCGSYISLNVLASMNYLSKMGVSP